MLKTEPAAEAPSEPSAAPPAVDEAAAFLLEAEEIFNRLVSAGAFDEENDDAWLPDEALTCDEACRMIGAVILLTLRLYPTLKDPSAMEAALRNYALRRAPGGLN